MPEDLPHWVVDYEDPESFDEAMQRKLWLLDQIAGVQNQLGDRSKKPVTDSPRLWQEYWSWKAKAKIAESKFMSVHRRNNYWIARYERAKLENDSFDYSPVEGDR